jgi:hypothetical protein
MVDRSCCFAVTPIPIFCFFIVFYLFFNSYLKGITGERENAKKIVIKNEVFCRKNDLNQNPLSQGDRGRGEGVKRA